MGDKVLNSKSVSIARFDGFVDENREEAVICKMWNALFLEVRLEVIREQGKNNVISN